MFTLPASMKKFRLKNNREKVLFHRRSRADNFVVCGTIWPTFILDIMHVLVNYKAKMDQINSNREKMETSIFIPTRAANSVVSLLILTNSNSSKFLCISLLPVSMRRIRSKTAKKTWRHRFAHILVILWRFFPTLKGS